MKKGKLKEEKVAKISITGKRAIDEFDFYILEKLKAKKKRMKSN